MSSKLCLLGLTWLLLTATVSRGAGTNPPSKPEDVELQGTWVPISVVLHPRPARAPKWKLAKLIIGMSHYKVVDAEGIVRKKGTYKVDAKKTPKTIDLFENPEEPSTGLGIYEITDGKLRACIADRGYERPSEFKAHNSILFIFRRADEGRIKGAGLID